MQLNQDQLAAVKATVEKRFSLITGGAGTGKTFTIQEIAKSLGDSVALCALAGKATARIREATGLPASTIHRLLGWIGGGQYLCGSLKGQSIIIDEASMVDSCLLAEIIKRVPDRLVLVGDASQLQPVGQGAPFHTLLSERPDLTTKLETCYRNSEAVYKAATAIRSGQMPLIEDHDGGEVWKIVSTGDFDGSLALIKELIQAGEIDFSQDIILCPKRQDTYQVNQLVVNIVNPDPAGRDRLSKGGKPTESDDDADDDDADSQSKANPQDWQVGDRIICLKNYSKLDTWNGTTGTITAIDAKGDAWVRGDIPFVTDTGTEAEILWPKGILKTCRHAYAMTIHKAQGSQYRKVFFFCHAKDCHVLSRNLIYTAVTRAKQECQVIGERKAFAAGLVKIPRRLTVMEELIKKERATANV